MSHAKPPHVVGPSVLEWLCADVVVDAVDPAFFGVLVGAGWAVAVGCCAVGCAATIIDCEAGAGRSSALVTTTIATKSSTTIVAGRL